MSESTHWQASQAEHRIAWITAGICIALLFIASLRPQWFEFSLPSFDNNTSFTSLHEDEPVAARPEAEVPSEPEPQQAEVIPPPAEKKIATVTPSTPVAEPAKKSPAKEMIHERQPPRQVTRQPAQPANGYYVQLGAFSEQPRAQGLADRLTSLGFQAQVVTRGKLHAVWAGPAPTQLKAEQLQKAIASKLSNKGFITHQTGT
ncbi:SPOR domain-containing protein [Mariprofundus erugo]|uniref:SPOR domain-containing protein n=1 Tax=Mariprofundus erugo TaxID=2528639 RepID=A0A5R9GZ97_9PROT|nr:SPOR domain-containing protein [Mariprofundus erugo]TLS69147.1 SPOR domain-containing protein [Mariprofundus erugo]